MVGHVSLYQLLANARIAACRVASYPSAFGPRDPQKPASTSREPLYGSRAGSKHARPEVLAMKTAATDDGKRLLTDLSDCVHGT
jgi:hypothetical protein